MQSSYLEQMSQCPYQHRRREVIRPFQHVDEILFHETMVYAFLLVLWLGNTFIASKLIAATVRVVFISAAGLFYRLNKRPDCGSGEAGRAAGELVSGTVPAMVLAAVLGVVMTLLEAWVSEFLG